MVQYQERYKKSIAIDMRKKGFSYREIETRLGVAKSTLNFWLARIKLDDSQVKKLRDRRLEALRRGSKKRMAKILEHIQTIKNSASKEIGKISHRELWLMGIMLYWRERLSMRREGDLKKGVRFTSSDPALITIFLKWLRDIGKIEKEEIAFDLFVPAARKASINKIIANWADITEFPKYYFSHTYFTKNYKKLPRNKKRNSGIPDASESNPQGRSSKRASNGFLRVRVKASSLMARQISGWIDGVIYQFAMRAKSDF